MKATEITSVISQARMAQLAANIQASNQLRALLDGYKPKPMSRFEIIQSGLMDALYRVRDAWLVLIGEAEIYHDD